MADHSVADGDCLSSIASEKKFRSYRSVWDHDDNGPLRAKRSNPNMLVAGDVVKLPTAKGKVEKRPTGQTHTFVVKAKKPVKLRIILVDAKGKPIADRDWQLKGPKDESGKTKADGLIETEIPPEAKGGKLTVTKLFEAPVIPPDGPPPPAPDPNVVVYPRPIASAEFKDAAPPDPTKLENDVEWTLKIGSLPSANHDTGVIARLENLGYSCGSEASPGPKTGAAVKAYERKHKIEPVTGSAASIRDAISAKHDKP